MLNAFENELKRLAADPKDPFHQKLRQRLGKRATLLLEKRLRQVILIMPILMRRIHECWRKSATTGKLERIGSFVSVYLYHPHDFLSEEEYGFFGYLDDAYLVALVYEKVISELQQKGIAPESQDAEFLSLIADTKRYYKALIPSEVEKIERMVEAALTRDNYEAFAAAFSTGK